MFRGIPTRIVKFRQRLFCKCVRFLRLVVASLCDYRPITTKEPKARHSKRMRKKKSQRKKNKRQRKKNVYRNKSKQADARQTKLQQYFKVQAPIEDPDGKNTPSSNPEDLDEDDSEMSDSLSSSNSPPVPNDTSASSKTGQPRNNSGKSPVKGCKCSQSRDASHSVASAQISPGKQQNALPDLPHNPKLSSDSRDIGMKVRNQHRHEDQGKKAHQISDSESECSGETQSYSLTSNSDSQSNSSADGLLARLGKSISQKMPWRETPKRQQAHLAMPSAWSARDTEAYRKGYPNKKDNLSLNDNWRFYNNEIKSTPRGTFIDVMHKEWYGDYSLLEEHHGYIQWLFPIREKGMNWQSQELQPHEAKKIQEDSKAKERVLKSYKMMLHFWGMRLKDDTTGAVVRGDNWKERFNNLNRSSHNYLRITRMLKSLGELGYERLKKPFLEFVLLEAINKKTLANAQRSCLHYWIHTLREDSERDDIQYHAENLLNKTGTPV